MQHVRIYDERSFNWIGYIESTVSDCISIDWSATKTAHAYSNLSSSLCTYLFSIGLFLLCNCVYIFSHFFGVDDFFFVCFHCGSWIVTCIVGIAVAAVVVANAGLLMISPFFRYISIICSFYYCCCCLLLHIHLMLWSKHTQLSTDKQKREDRRMHTHTRIQRHVLGTAVESSLVCSLSFFVRLFPSLTHIHTPFLFIKLHARKPRSTRTLSTMYRIKHEYAWHFT